MIYQYKCNCGNEFEDFKSVAERHTSVCPKCGKIATLVFSPTKGNIDFFRPYWDMHLQSNPTLIESRSQKKTLMKKLGVVEK